jgi:hypothetical protein
MGMVELAFLYFFNYALCKILNVSEIVFFHAVNTKPAATQTLLIKFNYVFKIQSLKNFPFF